MSCVCFGIFRPTRECFTHLEMSSLLVKGYKFWPTSELMAIEQWLFFNVPHLLWHGPNLYNGQLRGPVTLSINAERLTVELSLPGLTKKVCPDRGLNPDLLHAMQTVYLYTIAMVNECRNKEINYPVQVMITEKGDILPRKVEIRVAMRSDTPARAIR